MTRRTSRRALAAGLFIGTSVRGRCMAGVEEVVGKMREAGDLKRGEDDEGLEEREPQAEAPRAVAPGSSTKRLAIRPRSHFS